MESKYSSRGLRQKMWLGLFLPQMVAFSAVLLTRQGVSPFQWLFLLLYLAVLSLAILGLSSRFVELRMQDGALFWRKRQSQPWVKVGFQPVGFTTAAKFTSDYLFLLVKSNGALSKIPFIAVMDSDSKVKQAFVSRFEEMFPVPLEFQQRKAETRVLVLYLGVAVFFVLSFVLSGWVMLNLMTNPQ